MSIQVSIVVPTYQRLQLLERCLHALTRQQFPSAEYEIIVCDDAGSVDCERLVRTIAAQTRVALHYIKVSEPGGDGPHGPAVARNRGWRAARGALIAFTDDDTIADARWLSEGLLAFTPTVVGAWGRIVVPIPPQPTDYQRDIAGLEGAECATANCFYRRSALLAVGGFDERFTAAWREDADLYFTLLRLGEVVYIPDAVVVHPVRAAPWGVSVSLQRKAMFNALLYKKHPQLYRARIQRRAPWHYYTMVLALAAAITLFLAGAHDAAILALAAWLLLVLRFAYKRLRHTAHHPLHVAEMLWTSVLIPPLSIFWRLRGAIKYRVLFL